ncbi:hypothetical protein UlMin_024045, partial [Ulmus minor]
MANNNIFPTAIVRELLYEDNYDDWSIQVETYLKAQDLWDVVEAPIPGEAETETDKGWYKRNAAALHAIQISCSSDTFNVIRKIRLAKEAWDTLATNFSNNHPPRNEKNNEYTQEYNRFFNNVGKGDWIATREFIRLHPEAVRVTNPIFNRTALHLAVTFGHLHIVEELVYLMTPPDLEIKEHVQFKTACQTAAENGNISMVKCMIEKDHNLLCIADSAKNIPIVNAVITGQKQMARYLYPLTLQQEVLLSNNGMHGASLMIECFYNMMFDIVFDLIEREPLLLISKSPRNCIPVAKLAYYSSLFPSGCQFKFWQQWIYNLTLYFEPIISLYKTNDATYKHTEHSHIPHNPRLALLWPCINHIYELKLVHIQSIELLNRMCKVIETLDENQIEEAQIRYALVEAASRGIIEYITNITKAIPKSMWNGNFAFDIFESAIRNREAKVFSLIYGLDDKRSIANLVNSNREVLLHVTGYIASSRKLNLIPGVALQMQRELQWYKEVEAITREGGQMYFNKYGKTPREVFTESHKDLKIEGEVWMKNTSTSCTVVGALIFTIMFTAAFTLPGGLKQDTGFPMFLDKKLFKLFIISDAISLFSSTTSVLTFLGIISSRYAEEDFLRSLLPKIMILGLSTLFISIAAMTTAFCAVIALLFHSQLWIVLLTILLATIPIVLFMLLQFPLLVEIFISTYGRSIFDRNVGNWLA